MTGSVEEPDPQSFFGRLKVKVCPIVICPFDIYLCMAPL